MNPGAPPPPPGYGWSQQPAAPGYGYGYGGPVKSQTPRTLGLLSMIFGGIVICTSLFGLITGGQMGTFSVQPSQRAAFEAYAHELHGYTIAQSSIMLLMSIALVVIGTGQRSYQRWAVGASIKWSIAAFAVIAFNAVGTVVWVLPAMDHLLSNLPANPINNSSMAPAMKMMIFLGLGANLPYPIILFSAFRKPHNVAAMDQPPLPVAEVRA